MKRTATLFFLLFITSTALPQKLIPVKTIGKFVNASAFSINTAGFIYVTDYGTNELIKLDTNGIQVKSIGGYGWDISLFDEPADVSADNLTVLVSDKNNNRIQIFDKDLNFLSEFISRKTLNEDQKFYYPVSAAYSSLGDLFILDSDNRRVLKYDIKGSFITQIGGNDAGQFNLINPLKIALVKNQFLYVLDEKEFVIFDYFGNGIIKLKSAKDYSSFAVSDNLLSFTYNGGFDILDIADNYKLVNSFPVTDTEIISVNIFEGKFYLLTPKTILVFHLIQ